MWSCKVSVHSFISVSLCYLLVCQFVTSLYMIVIYMFVSYEYHISYFLFFSSNERFGYSIRTPLILISVSPILFSDMKYIYLCNAEVV